MEGPPRLVRRVAVLRALSQALPGLWIGDELTVGAISTYFAGGQVVQVPREGYEEPVTIPKADRPAIERAIEQAVQAGQLRLLAGPASLWNEPVSPGVITDAATLRSPPTTIPVSDVLPEQLGDAWKDDVTTAAAVAIGLSKKADRTLPWPAVRSVIDAALNARILTQPVDSGPWPCDFAGASAVRLAVPGKLADEDRTPPDKVPPVVEKRPGVVVAEADLTTAQVQDLADQVGELVRAAVGHKIKMRFRIEVGGAKPLPPDVLARLNEILKEVAKDLRLQ